LFHGRVHGKSQQPFLRQVVLDYGPAAQHALPLAAWKSHTLGGDIALAFRTPAVTATTPTSRSSLQALSNPTRRPVEPRFGRNRKFARSVVEGGRLDIGRWSRNAGDGLLDSNCAQPPPTPSEWSRLAST
jgi:hypothetical protein